MPVTITRLPEDTVAIETGEGPRFLTMTVSTLKEIIWAADRAGIISLRDMAKMAR